MDEHMKAKSGMKQEIAESAKSRLFNNGFSETDKPCPECGCFVWECDQLFDEGDLIEIWEECPCCEWGTVTYDA